MSRSLQLIRDAWLPVALGALAVHEATTSYADLPAGEPALLSVLLPMAALTGWRRREPALVSLGVVTLTAVLVLAVLPAVSDQPPLTAFLALLTTLFSLGVHGSGRHHLTVSLAVGAVLASLQVASAVAGQPLDDVIPSLVFLGGAFAVGRLIHHTRGEAREERLRAERAEQERDAHALQAAEEERARIARELHDVVAHALSVIVIQASVEARLHQDQHGTTAETLRTIERQGREAMTELRRLLGLLREEGQGAASAPLPSLSTADALLADLRRAGHDVAFEQRGRLDDLPAGVDLAAYRVLQESLTNAARHAPGSDVRVSLAREDGAVAVNVDSDRARLPAVAMEGAGHGLAGMRERVRLYGGRLRAGARPDGGFTVAARIPLAGPGEEPR